MTRASDAVGASTSTADDWNSRFAGPGSNAILHIGSQWWNVYHAYDTLASGIPTLRIAQLVWNEGWPVPEQP